IATTIGRTARLWDARTATLVRTLVANPGRSSFTSLTAVAFSPDGKTLAGVAGEEGGGEALLWDTRDGRTLRSLSPPIGELDSLTFSPDGRFVAGAGDNNARVWNAQTGALEPTLRANDSPADRAPSPPEGRTR